jgi:hypothetical protein
MKWREIGSVRMWIEGDAEDCRRRSFEGEDEKRRVVEGAEGGGNEGV